MAGDWIKMRTSLLTNPKVNGIARELESDTDAARVLAPGYVGVMSDIVTRNVMRHVTVSSLLVIWGAANEHTKDGVFVNADLSDIDDLVGIPGFAAAMETVGWLAYDAKANCVTLPNFNEYNTSGSTRSAGAKTSAERQKEYRDRKKSQESDVTSDVTSNRREEKRREEKKEETPASPDGEPAKSRGGEITFKAFIARCKQAGERPIPEDDSIFEYCQRAGIPDDFLGLVWDHFRERYIDDAKRYKDWRAAFRNCVKDDWFKLWRCDNGQYLLTSKGQQAMTALRNKEAK